MPLCGASDNQVVTFEEVGLPTGVAWSVSLDGVVHSSTVTAGSTNITFSEPSGPEYPFSVGNVTGFVASPAQGAVDVAGTAVLVNISFASTSGGGSPAPPTSGAPSAVSPVLPCHVCTYPAGTPSPGPNCYATPRNFPSFIGPTESLSPPNAGPLPMGAMAVAPEVPYFYNLYDGMLRGADYSLMISVVIVGIGALVGLFIGAVSGYFGGWVDEVLMRITDVMLTIPSLLFTIVLLTVVKTDYHTVFGLSPLNTSLFILITTFAITWWPFYARLVRGQVLVVREQKFVEAARASGASSGRIVVRHIVPNSMYPVLVSVSLDVGTVPLLTGGIIFIGIQIFPSLYFPEWGSITAVAALNVVQLFLGQCETGACFLPWWQLLFPGLAVFLFAVSVNFLSDGLRDALDPRLRK
jgi:peptide/nickel transport system permease protein